MNMKLKRYHDISSASNMRRHALKRLLTLGCGLIFLTACSSVPARARYMSKETSRQRVVSLAKESTPMEQLNHLISSVIAQGERLLGKRYRTRGIAPWPLDCSGYVSYLYSKQGLSIPRSSAALSTFARKVDDPQPGDLVFFRGRNASSPRVGHVALVVENNDGDLVIMHSTNSRGIIKHRLKGSQYFSSRYLFVGRIPQISDLWRQHREAGRAPRPAPLKPQSEDGGVVRDVTPGAFTFDLSTAALLAEGYVR